MNSGNHLHTANNQANRTHPFSFRHGNGNPFILERIDQGTHQGISDSTRHKIYSEAGVQVPQDAMLPFCQVSPMGNSTADGDDDNEFDDETPMCKGQAEYTRDNRKRSSEGPMVCPECHVPCFTGIGLEWHAIDTGHRAFKCDAAGCEKTFTRRDSMAKHKRAHGSMPWVCLYETCGMQPKKFTKEDHWRRHLRDKHGILPEAYFNCK